MCVCVCGCLYSTPSFPGHLGSSTHRTNRPLCTARCHEGFIVEYLAGHNAPATCALHFNKSCTYHQEVKPTCFVGVPRVWEKFKERIELQLSQTSGFKGFVVEKSKVGIAYMQETCKSFHVLCTCSKLDENQV